ncbi:hypothetical protein [Noviherbaspirillum sp.]|uniref:hypothetical protein n=1 Tax=Noviherbaspirillum sp. TaxID=1926288 RepID=UPI002D2C0637|nr:hypothetical protein [Noviherbaspirillum sp.]HZW23664.1 hypothetical protein [Noviherbaspirillum sp.]
MKPEVSKLAAAENRLREEILTIVRRRVPRGTRLSWRMMFEIEDEAVSKLQQDDDLDIHYINMMVSPSAQRFPSTEKPAALAEVYPTHTALRMIQEAHQLGH